MYNLTHSSITVSRISATFSCQFTFRVRVSLVSRVTARSLHDMLACLSRYDEWS